MYNIDMKLEILIATNNKHKVKEFEEMSKGLDIRFYSLKDINLDIDVLENGSTYQENAFLKASEISKHTNLIVLADDSGLEIDALGTAFPGIHTKRYAEEHGNFPAVLDKTIKDLKNVPNRCAHYCCAICVMNLKQEPLYFYGKCYGKIDTEIRGNNGFGFDPIFISDEVGKNLGLVEDNIKNAISHRGKAFMSFINYLKENKYFD